MAELSREKFQIVGCENANSEEILRPNMTYWQDAWRRLKQNKVAILSLIVLIVVIIMTIVGPYLVPYKHFEQNTSIINHKPYAAHLFGTDNLGRDMFARLWMGGRVSIIIGVSGALIDCVVGVTFGGISGYFGGLVDDIMMRILEILVSIPYLLTVILISLILGKGIVPLIIAICITGWTGMARLIRGQVLQIKEQEYVLAAHALGANPSRIIARHLLPNTIGIMIVDITLDVPFLIFSEAFLSYIGLGIQSPNTSLGSLAAGAQQNLLFYPYQLFFPAALISLIMLSFNLLGDGLRDALDPRLRQ